MDFEQHTAMGPIKNIISISFMYKAITRQLTDWYMISPVSQINEKRFRVLNKVYVVRSNEIMILAVTPEQIVGKRD